MEAIEELEQLSDSMKQAASLLADEDDETSSSSSKRPSTSLNVVAIGSTGAGKSAVLNSLIGHPALPTGEGGATRAPICIDLKRDSSLSSKSIVLQIDSKSQPVSASALRHSLQDRLSKISSKSRDEIYLKLRTSTAPPLKLVDLPGVDKSNLDDSMTHYVEHNDAILLVVISAAQAPEVASCKAIRIAKEYDSECTRTVGVISKIDQAASEPKVLAAVQALLSNQGPRSTADIPWVALIGQSVSIASAQSGSVGSDNSLETAWRAESESLKSILTGAPQSKLGRLALVETLAHQIRSRMKVRLPNLLSGLQGKSQVVQDELVRLGEQMVHSAEGTKALALELCREFEDKFLLHITGGEGDGWKVVASFEGNFPNRIKQLPLDRHFDINNVKRIVLEADGYQPYLISPEKGLRSLIKGVLEQAKEPSRLCVDEVHRVLVDIVSSAANATPGLGRYPPFKREVVAIASDALDGFKTDAKKMVVSLVDMERAFVPPQHFIRLVQRRFQDDLESTKYATMNGDNLIKVKYKIDGSRLPEPASRISEKEPDRTGKSLKAKVLSRVFSEDYERVKKKILDPRGPTVRRWNKILLVACLIGLFVDPLFFYLPAVQDEVCIDIGTNLEIALTVIRSIADVFYMIQIYIRFRTAYVAPSSRVFGRGELVIDSSKIAQRYYKKGFWIDLIAALPLPQVLIWGIIPNLSGSTMANTKNVLRFIIIFQYLPRLYLIFPLSSQIVKTTGVVTETAWAGAAYNLMLYMLASHVGGACWYLLSIERQEACWRHACSFEERSCDFGYFDCRRVKEPQRSAWFQSSNITNQCNPNTSDYPFGIYSDAVTANVTTASFFNKYFYCLWWGLKNLSSLGQNLATSTYIGEIGFAIIIATLGLVLFALLIGNMQTYLQSTTVRLEEWRIRRTDTEQWMHHRQLPQELRQSVRKYDQYKWVATRGVDEEALLEGLPLDLRRDIKRHLCYDLVRRVPLFDQMDERMLDAICERLKPALCTQGTCLVREGDPVNEMLFIIRGNLDSYTTNGGRTGFFNSCRIGPGDFCGEELLTWALDPRPGVILPSSTRTVKAVSEVESFALVAEDLKFVAAQFRRLHSKQLRHKFRFYSHQWRTWAACFIQAAWRRHKKRKGAAELRALENLMDETESINGQMDKNAPTPGSGFAARLATSRRGLHKHSSSDSNAVSSLQKPAEPDFSVDEE